MACARGLIACLAVLFAAGAATAEDPAGRVITKAEFAEPTTRYAHGVLGDAEEWGTLRVTISRKFGQDGGLIGAQTALTYQFRMPDELVFEDLAPRLWDLTGDGAPEVVVVQSHRDLGARLLVIGVQPDGKPGAIAATPHIGRSHRWLAPVGAGDLDGDGAVEIAYVDRPHLAKTLRIWRFDGQALHPVADVSGLTNHRIGWDHIPGGLRDCGDGPELITASGDWRSVMATRWDGRKAWTRRMGAYDGPDSLNRALSCN